MLNLPHKAAQRISDENFFLYFLISGVSPMASVVVWVGATLTLICDPRRDAWDTEPIVDPPAPKPKAENDRWCRIDWLDWLTACRYYNIRYSWLINWYIVWIVRTGPQYYITGLSI